MVTAERHNLWVLLAVERQALRVSVFCDLAVLVRPSDSAELGETDAPCMNLDETSLASKLEYAVSI